MAASNNAFDREKAIELAIGSIEKQFGKGSIMRLGEDEAIARDIATISTPLTANEEEGRHDHERRAAIVVSAFHSASCFLSKGSLGVDPSLISAASSRAPGIRADQPPAWLLPATRS